VSGHAPEGYYNTVDVTVRLANGKLHDARWVTPLAMGRAYGKAPKWIRQSLREAKVPGRSQIVAIDVRVTLSKLPDGKAFDQL
jgi:hypothetical protein